MVLVKNYLQLITYHSYNFSISKEQRIVQKNISDLEHIKDIIIRELTK